jgi:hypothetical protein
LKKTTTLYNKAQNDLLKKLKLGDNSRALKSEHSQGSTSIEIQNLAQGPLTTTNKSTITPSRNAVSSKIFQSPTTQLLKRDFKTLLARQLSPKPNQEHSAEMSNKLTKGFD